MSFVQNCAKSGLSLSMSDSACSRKLRSPLVNTTPTCRDSPRVIPNRNLSAFQQSYAVHMLMRRRADIRWYSRLNCDGEP